MEWGLWESMMFIVRRSELAKPLHAWLFLTVNGSCIYFANLRWVENYIFFTRNVEKHLEKYARVVYNIGVE